MDTTYFDFGKAFERVTRQGLLGKLKSYSIKGKILEWIKIFFSNRCALVKGN